MSIGVSLALSTLFLHSIGMAGHKVAHAPNVFLVLLQVVGREGNTVTYIGASGRGIVTHIGARAYGTVDSLDSSYRLQCREDGRVLWAKLGSFDWEEGTNQQPVLHVPDDEVEEGTDNAILNPLIDRANSGRQCDVPSGRCR